MHFEASAAGMHYGTKDFVSRHLAAKAAPTIFNSLRSIFWKLIIPLRFHGCIEIKL